ncbi:flagellar brake protein [Salisediminibacterium beveridgei]|uniref:C-di-GMP-binding flagellar brake protein YcgR, contains PilZNR and PilZ domains n=1 Tax=Salisediminibacterium beveridgei TaxID=632773 RepID=A0A1D7QUW7_9BACI|nr:flagellar brake domain-containing protein [Salisediminibacterium beveridgei]AOM82787.1 hypothetical protein BBEV_1424 [Salisediminibacterium beveridgei]
MIKIGQTIHLELKVPDGDQKQRYKSKLLDYERSFMYIDFPVDEQTSKPSFFMEGTEFRVWFAGKDNAVYSFETQILGKVDRGIPMLVMKDPGKDSYLRIQRREYVRVETALDVAVHPVKEGTKPFTTVTIDVSGGGAALVLQSNHQLKDSEVLNLWIAIPFRIGGIEYINTKAEIIRIIDGKSPIKCSCQFIDIDEGDRQKIIRYAFEKQLERNRRERIK